MTNLLFGLIALHDISFISGRLLFLKDNELSYAIDIHFSFVLSQFLILS